MDETQNSAGWSKAERTFKADSLDVAVFKSIDDLASDAAVVVNSLLRDAMRQGG